MNKNILYLITALIMLSVASATPLSIIESDYLNFDSTIGAPVWQVNVRGDNDASYTVFGDNQEISAEVDSKEITPASDFTLTHNIRSESCEYSLLNTARHDIYQYEIRKTGNNIFFTSKQKFLDECYDSTGGIYAWGESITLSAFTDMYCLIETKIANAGDVQEGKINFNADFSIQKGDESPITKTITTLASNAGQIPSNILFADGKRTVARVRWIGGTTFGEMCPGQDNQVAIESSNKWFTADKDSYTLYDDQYTALQEIVSKAKQNNDITSLQLKNLKTAIDSTNERTSAVLEEKPITQGALTSIIQGSKAIIELPRDHLIYAPDFQILVNADWIGVVYQTSKPKITDAGFNSCTEEGSNTFYATIKNVGSSPSSFDIGATCQSGISISATNRNIALDPEESGTVTIPFTITLDNDASKTCTIQVADRTNIEMEDRTSITTDCQASKFCQTEGENKCFGEVEKMCDNGQWIETLSLACQTQVCNRDDVCDVNDGESFETCGGKAASNNDCATCNLNDRCDATETVYSCAGDCGPPKEVTPTWVWIIVGVALALAVFFLMLQIKPAKKGKKGKKGRK